METVLIVGLLCALIFFLNSSNVKTVNPPAPLPQKPSPPPSPKRFVSVVFKEGSSKRYDYFIGNTYNLKINDRVEVPVHDKYTGMSEVKIATVKYVSSPGEVSEYAWATVIRKVSYSIPRPTPSPPPPKPLPPSPKSFVQVIFKKSGKKRYDYFLGNNSNVRVGDFVVVHVNDKFSGDTKWKIAKVVYMSKPGEFSKHAKSAVIKKADYPKW